MQIKTYAQAKEDLKLWPIFRDTPEGYFVDVGAHDGRTLSNTYAYEEIGWRGVVVEPHPDFIKVAREIRPRSKCYAVACGPQNVPEVVFYSTLGGILSTVDKEETTRLDTLYGYRRGRVEIKVPMMTLDTILHDAGAPRNIDLVSIDTEGYEVEVLKGFTHSYWQPRVLLIEGYDEAHKASLRAYMADTGYFYSCVIGVNLVYCRFPEDVGKAAGVVDGTL